MTYDQILQLITALVPVLVAVLGIVFKLNQDKREEVAHALDFVIRALQEGSMNIADAKKQLLGTGAVSESKVNKLLSAVEIKTGSSYENQLYPGVGVSISSSGQVEIYPVGLLNKLAHKASKYLKKKF